MARTTTLRAYASAHGWDADVMGPVDEATDAALEAFLASVPARGGRRYEMAGDVCTLDMIIEANAGDLYVLSMVGALDVGDAFDTMQGERVVRVS